MMVKRPEGLFPVEHAKAEMHGIGVAADVTGGSADELAVGVEEVIEEPEYSAAFAADTPAETLRDDDLPEDTR